MLNQHHTDKVKISFVLFDEIEKASDALWNLRLGILDKATLTLGDNCRVDFSCCLIFMTSNLVSWIRQGAPEGKPADAQDGRPDPLVSDKDRRFWAFQPPKRPEVPVIRITIGARNPPSTGWCLARLIGSWLLT